MGPGLEEVVAVDRFRDRVDAGRRLAPLLARFAGDDPIVLGLPRGGVPVAAEVSRALDAPLDVIVVRKLGWPARPELAMGAVGEDGVLVVDADVVRATQVSREVLARVEQEERAEVERRVQLLRSGRPRLDLAGRTAVIVDDGIATGSTARAACLVARHLGAAHVVAAAPVVARDSVRLLSDADDVVYVLAPSSFQAVGEYYDDFSETTDDEVVELLQRPRSDT